MNIKKRKDQSKKKNSNKPSEPSWKFWIPVTISLFSLISSIGTAYYTEYRIDKNNETNIGIKCNIPENSLGKGDKHNEIFYFDAICHITNLSSKKISIQNIDAGTTDENNKYFNRSNTHVVKDINNKSDIFPVPLDINEQRKYLIEISVPMYLHKQAYSCLPLEPRPIKELSKCFIDNDFSINNFYKSVDKDTSKDIYLWGLPGLAVKVTTTDQKEFIEQIPLLTAFPIYEKNQYTEEFVWNLGNTEPRETWHY